MILCGALIDASCFVGFFLSLFFETMLTKIGESAKQKPRKLGPQREPMEF